MTLLKNKNFQVDKQKCKSLKYLDNRLAKKQASYIAILRGQIWRSNVAHDKSKYDFYRLVGFAYSTNKLEKLWVPDGNYQGD